MTSPPSPDSQESAAVETISNASKLDEEDLIIQIEGLEKSYQDVTALHDTKLDINRGEFFTLLGPSGAGKSTLLHILGGFVSPSRGKILLDGLNHTDSRPQERPLTTVFQEYALFPHMTVEENVYYGLQAQQVPEDAQDKLVNKYLQMLEIDDLRDRNPTEISGGQRQRVALARALVVEPDILLLDEPLGSLDEKLRRQMQVELSELQESLGTTFVYVTHDQEEALTMSDSIALLNQGRVVEVGSPEMIYSAPKNEFTARFLGSGNIFHGEISSINDDKYTVSTNFSTDSYIGVSRLEDLEVGDEIAICIRTQKVTLADENNVNQITGTLDRKVYKGDTFDYIFDIQDGHTLTASLETDIGLEVGDEASLSWSVTDCYIVQV